jgi:hypothetical protein
LLPVPKIAACETRDSEDTYFATGCKLNFVREARLNGREIGIGIVGGGYMGKAHAVAMSAVGAVFDTGLRPRLEMICAGSSRIGERYRAAYGFARAARDWQELVADPQVEAVIIASPQIHPPRHCRGRLRARQAGVLRKAAGRLAGRQPRHGRRGRGSAWPTWSASTISARPPAGSPAS